MPNAKTTSRWCNDLFSQFGLFSGMLERGAVLSPSLSADHQSTGLHRWIFGNEGTGEGELGSHGYKKRNDTSRRT